MDQIPQGLWVGPTDGAEGYSLPQELEKAREVGYFSSVFINTDSFPEVIYN